MTPKSDFDPNSEYALQFALERVLFLAKHGGGVLDEMDRSCLRLVLAEIKRLRPEVFEEQA